MTSSPHSPPVGANVNGSCLPPRVLVAETRLHLGARQPFPSAVIDFPQTRRAHRRERMRCRQQRAVSRVRCSGLQ